MLDLNGLTTTICAAVLAFALGSGIGAWGAHSITATKLNAEHTAAIAEIRSTISDANVKELNISLGVERQQAASLERLEKEKLDVIAERNKALDALRKRSNTTQSVVSAGGVFIDPGAKGGTANCSKNDTNAASEAARVDAADTGAKLSGSATQFLLDLATSAEVTRLDLIASRKFGEATYQENLKLRSDLTDLLKGK